MTAVRTLQDASWFDIAMLASQQRQEAIAAMVKARDITAQLDRSHPALPVLNRAIANTITQSAPEPRVELTLVAEGPDNDNWRTK